MYNKLHSFPIHPLSDDLNEFNVSQYLIWFAIECHKILPLTTNVFMLFDLVLVLRNSINPPSYSEIVMDCVCFKYISLELRI